MHNTHPRKQTQLKLFQTKMTMFTVTIVYCLWYCVQSCDESNKISPNYMKLGESYASMLHTRCLVASVCDWARHTISLRRWYYYKDYTEITPKDEKVINELCNGGSCFIRDESDNQDTVLLGSNPEAWNVEYTSISIQ